MYEKGLDNFRIDNFIVVAMTLGTEVMTATT